MEFVQWIQQRSVAYTVYGLALTAIALLLTVTVVKLFIAGTKSDRLEYLKSYKKGQFVIIYFIAIPLYFFGALHAADEISDGTDVLNCFLNSIASSFDLVKLDFGFGDVAVSMRADGFYYATMIICYVVTVFNVLMFSASLVWQRFKNFCKRTAARFSKSLYIVVGGDVSNILLMNSLKKPGRGIMLVKPDSELRDKLYLNGICYSAFDGASDAFYKKIKSFFGLRYALGLGMRKKVTVIINTGDDERNLLYLKALNKLLFCKVRASKSQRFADVPVNATGALLTGYVFCKAENRSAFSELVKDARGHVDVLNRYEQIALGFVAEYPLTHFMTGEHVDFSKGLIKNGVEINVCFVGFGPTNRQIFLKTVSDAQFFTEADGQTVHKKVHYYVFDREAAHNDKISTRRISVTALNSTKNTRSTKPKRLKRKFKREATNGNICRCRIIPPTTGLIPKQTNFLPQTAGILKNVSAKPT